MMRQTKHLLRLMNLLRVEVAWQQTEWTPIARLETTATIGETAATESVMTDMGASLMIAEHPRHATTIVAETREIRRHSFAKGMRPELAKETETANGTETVAAGEMVNPLPMRPRVAHRLSQNHLPLLWTIVDPSSQPSRQRNRPLLQPGASAEGWSSQKGMPTETK